MTSERNALVLSIPSGILSLAVNGAINMRGDFLSIAPIRLIVFGSLGALGVAAIVLMADYFLGFNLKFSIDNLIQKLTSAGDGVRDAEATSLIRGIIESHRMGVGHGIAATNIASAQFPWRYEWVWLATIYRVGFLGAAVYAAPFLATLWVGGRRLLAGQLSPQERFLFGGFCAAFNASTTNPYIEGIVFQWMYVLPILYFLSSRRRPFTRHRHSPNGHSRQQRPRLGLAPPEFAKGSNL